MLVLRIIFSHIWVPNPKALLWEETVIIAVACLSAPLRIYTQILLHILNKAGFKK